MGLTKNRSSVSIANSVLRFCLSAVIVLPVAAYAGEFGGGVRAGIAYTDNVYLETAPDDLDEMVYVLSPFIKYDHESQRLDVTGRYEVDWNRFEKQDTSRNYDRGNISVIGKALEGELLFEVGALRKQVLADPNSVIPFGNLNLADNLADQNEWWLSPQYTHKFSRNVTFQGDYRYSEVQIDGPSTTTIQDNNNQSAIAGLDNYAAGQGFTWALLYDWRRTEYEEAPPWEYQQASAQLGMWVSDSTRIFAGGGKESAWDRPLDPNLADPFWEAGFAIAANEKLSAEFAVGERSFGSSWRGDIEYTFRRGSTALGYSESPSTTGYDPESLVSRDTNSDGLNDFLNTPGSAERFISERLLWNLKIQLRKVDFTLEVFDEKRFARVSAVGVLLPDQEQFGAELKTTWRAGVRTDFVAYAAFVSQDIDLDNESDFTTIGFDTNYQLGSRSSLSLRYAYSEQQPRDEFSRSADYQSNVLALYFLYSL